MQTSSSSIPRIRIRSIVTVFNPEGFNFDLHGTILVKMFCNQQGTEICKERFQSRMCLVRTNIIFTIKKAQMRFNHEYKSSRIQVIIERISGSWTILNVSNKNSVKKQKFRN